MSLIVLYFYVFVIGQFTQDSFSTAEGAKWRVRTCSDMTRRVSREDEDPFTYPVVTNDPVRCGSNLSNFPGYSLLPPELF